MSSALDSAVVGTADIKSKTIWQIKPADAKKIDRWDYRSLFPFFQAPQLDYLQLREFITYRFQNNPSIATIAEAFIDNVEQIEKGNGARLEMQLLIARSALSMMVNVGRIAVAKVFLKACQEKWGENRFKEAGSMLLLADENIERLDVCDKPWRDYQIIDRQQETTVLVFCGLAWKFGVEVNYLALWLRSLPVNIIYIRDQNARLYLAGLKSLGNLDKTIASIKADLERIGTKRIIAMGASGGVYGALHYGYLLGANQVLCFAGPTGLEPGKMEAVERPVYEQVNELIVKGEVKEPNLRAYLQESKISVRYFYGDGYEFDAIQVNTIKDIPTVSIEPVEDWNQHIVIGEMARRNKLKGVFSDMLKA